MEVPENYGGNFPLYLTKVSLISGWPTVPASPASPTSSTPFSVLLWLSFNPALQRVCGTVRISHKILIPEEGRALKSEVLVLGFHVLERRAGSTGEHQVLERTLALNLSPVTYWLHDLRQVLALSEPQFPHRKWCHWVEEVSCRPSSDSLHLCCPHQLPLPHEKAGGQIVLLGHSGMATEGPFAVDPESGFLLVTRALDREEQAEYQLQVQLGQV